MPQPAPILFERKVLPKVWGGRALETVLGLRLPAGEAVGETWELYDRPEGSSPVRGGQGTLADLLAADREGWLGRGVATGHGGRFPLLLKFLDARQALSVQVHPDDAAARPLGDGGKDEAWVVLHAGPDARIIRGLRPEVREPDLRAKAAGPDVEPLLWAFRPAPGDCVHIPPGTIHALGPDVVVFEVQQNSDITYRLYDWGRPREVHTEQALAVARLDRPAVAGDRPVVMPRDLPDGGRLLVQTPHFRVRRYELPRPFELATRNRFATVTVVSGRGMLGWHSGGAAAPLQLGPGDTVLVPAAVDRVFLSPIGRLDAVVADPGER